MVPISRIMPHPGELLWFTNGSSNTDGWDPVIYLRHEGGNYGIMLHEGKEQMVHISRLHRGLAPPARER